MTDLFAAASPAVWLLLILAAVTLWPIFNTTKS
jgi:hypothetical protein